MEYQIREMRSGDLTTVIALWESTEGLFRDDADNEECLKRYLQRNPGLSHVAIIDREIVGTVKCGQDGRRGYLHHLVVKEGFRKRGIGKILIKEVLRNLKEQGIDKCNSFVLDDNKNAIEFWKYNGWITLEYNYRTLQMKTE